MTPFHDKVTPLPGPVPIASVQGTLALDLQPRLDPPEVHRSAVGRAGGDVISIDLPVRRDLEKWARRYTQAVVEIVHGDRPVSQLVRWTAPRVHEDLARRAVLVAQAGLHRAGHGRGRRPDLRPQVESIHSCFVSREIAEVSARVRYGGRSRAVAARFEILGGRWQCTALEFA
ncbi:Rv3235 family protein [Nocardioides pacificus]